MRRNGFTFLELMIVTLIVITLILIALPRLRDLHRSQEADRVTSSLRHLVSLSRGHAVTSHLSLTICGSSDTLRCDADWATGVLLLEDGNRNGTVDGADRILQYVPLHIQPSVLVWNGFGGNRITIETTGTSFASNGTFTYCPEDKEARYRRQVVLNRGGRARVSRDTNGDGIHEDSSGNPIACP